MSRAECNMKVDHKENSVIQYAYSSAVSAGEVIYLNGIGALVAAEALDASESGSYYYQGVGQFPITSGVTITAGQKVCWDISANTCNLANSSALVAGDFFLGTAVKNGTAAGGYVEVALNLDLQNADQTFRTIAYPNSTETVELTDYGLILDATCTTQTLTMCDAATAAKLNRQVSVIAKNADNTVTIARGGADTIMGATSITLDVREAVTLVPVGTDWIAISNAYNVATAAIQADAVTNAKIADDAVSKEHLDSGIEPSYIIVGYGSTTSNAGTQGTITISGALTTDFAMPTLLSGWTNSTNAGASIDYCTVSSASTVTYKISGTSVGGTAGGIGVMIGRAAS